MLNLPLKLGDVYQPSAMPGPSSAVAQTVEPNNNNNNPIMAYSAGYANGYNQAGGSQYLQYPPECSPLYPQSYPPVMGPAGQYYPPVMGPAGQYYPPVMGPAGPYYPPVMGPAGPYYPPVMGPAYYPPAGPYAVPPPPQSTGLFGGGFGTGLLSGAREGLLLGQALFGTFGGGGFGGGGTGLLSGAPQGLLLAQALLGGLGGGTFY